MRNENPRIILFLAIFSVLGLCVGLGIQSPLYRLIDDGTFTRWQALGSPPDKIVDLLGIGQEGRRDVILVETVSGRFYRCCISARNDWEEIEPSEGSETICNDLPAGAPPHPGNVVDCAEIGAYEYATERIQYVLLEDGSVWHWYYHAGIDTIVSILIYSSLLGGLIGLLIAWIFDRRPAVQSGGRRDLIDPQEAK